MKILLMSDSHMLRGMEPIVLTEQADLNLHLGDSQFMKNNMEIDRFDYAVRGNCDFERFDEHKIIIVEGQRWLLIHGHQVSNAHDFEALADYAKSYNCQVVCYGHTHIPVYTSYNGVTILNPGSFARSRSSYPNSYMTVMIVDQQWTVLLKNAKNEAVIKELKINE